MTFEENVELYENGVKLAAECRNELERAKLKITRQEEELNESGR